jgi:hypothetical protein
MNPWDAVEEGFCTTCDSYTTNYDHHGDCKECGTPLLESHEGVNQFVERY